MLFAVVALFSAPVPVMAQVTITISPTTATQRIGSTRTFTASVSGSTNRTVTWLVDGVPGGNATAGTIATNGLYAAPANVPTPNTVTVTARSNADPTKTASAVVTLQNPTAVLSSVSPTSVLHGPVQFTLTGTGFTPVSRVLFGGAAVPTTYVSPTELRANVSVGPVVGHLATLQVQNPDPGTTTSASRPVQVEVPNPLITTPMAVRFLEQATWGPTPQSLARVRTIGIAAYLNEQFAAPPSTYPDAPDEMQGLTELQKQFYRNAFQQPDQLRQRVAFALSQIWVVSGLKTGGWHQMAPYLRILNQHAFGNYRDLMEAVTLSPTMGRYLDNVNNEKPRPGIAANENYARELLQLFTLGVYQLNLDGSLVLDAQNRPVPAYTENDVKQLALALTGWTYPTRPGATPRFRNPSFYGGPMESFDAYHDTSAKTLLGRNLPAGQNTLTDTRLALDTIFEHPNLGPFVARRLIQSLVTSTPSANYVTRVAQVFNNNGQGRRGDLQAVVRTILSDGEARGSSNPWGQPIWGITPAKPAHLREPVLFTIAAARALNAATTTDINLSGWGDQMGQRLFYPPSVFNYFSLLYRLPGGGPTAPEFQILTPSTSLNRANYIYRLPRNGITSAMTVDIGPFERLAADNGLLLDMVNTVVMGGRMQTSTRTSIQNALAATTDARTRARNAIFLAMTAPEYQVQQ